MPHFVRLGCAGIAVITIAALTSIGLFAVVAGGLPFSSVAVRGVTTGAPVMVTIQALPATPTTATLPTTTPAPASLIPARPVHATPATATAGAPAAQATPAPAPTPNTGPQPSPAALASPRAEAAQGGSVPASEPTVTHDGLSFQVIGVDRQWQPAAADTAPPPGHDPVDLVAVHIRVENRAGDMRYVASTDVLLVAEDGARFAPRVAGLQREPRLQTVPVPTDDGLRGWLTFEVPAGTALRGIQWSPTRPDRPRAEATYLVSLPHP